jgi:hypothetical protein
MANFFNPGKLFLLIFIMLSGHLNAAYTDGLSAEQKIWLAKQIFANECASKLECLTSWNEGEDFPSMGIGHFIWYRENQQQVYEETFPALLDFMENAGVTVPAWLGENGYNNPWPNREQFYQDINGPRLAELRSFLHENIEQQCDFILYRFTAGISALYTAEKDTRILKNKIDILASSQTPLGIYALVDYVNFKGTGLKESEQYQGQGWGLKQVLMQMPEQLDEQTALQEFIAAAKTVLLARVENSPAEKNERRWLEGWYRRLETYTVQ